MRIVTFNTWGVPFTADLEMRTWALSQILASCHYDIVCLQEVWLKKNFDTISNGARSSGLVYQHHFKSGRAGSGLVILSRHPILDADFHKFRLGGRIDTKFRGDYLVGKGIGFARIQTPTGLLDVFNTHPNAQYDPDEHDEYKAHRAGQHYEVTQFVRHHSGNHPFIVMGDFNMLDHQVGYRLMTQYLSLTDCWRECHPADDGFTFRRENIYNHKKSDGVDERLDYVFTRHGNSQKISIKTVEHILQEIDDSDKAYSDHDGVMVEITIQDTKSAIDLTPNPQAQHRVLSEVMDMLAVGTMDAEYRKKLYLKRARFSINLLGIPAFIIGKVFGETQRNWLRRAVLLYSLVFWFLAEINVSDEITQMTTISDEIQHQLDALSQQLER